MNHRQPTAVRIVLKTGDHFGSERTAPLPSTAQEEDIFAAFRRRLAQHLIPNLINTFMMEAVVPRELVYEAIASRRLLRLKQ